MNYNETHITHDVGLESTVVFDDDADGITTDSDGNVGIDWDDVERVSLQSTDSFGTVPHASAFDSSEFYRLEATVARPIPQPYIIPSSSDDEAVGTDSTDVDSVQNDSVVWLKKPREELQRAAWSLDNRPWTLDHPDTGLVRDVSDIRGFWDDTYYKEGVDDLKSYLHIPVGDEEAQQYIEDNGDVSVGFKNKVTPVDEYDGDVGGEGPDVATDSEYDIEIDGYQTDMYFDHVASVAEGRCSASDGCGIDSPDASYKGTVITNTSEDAQTSVLTQKQQMADSKYTHEGSWYAVPPEDNPDDEWKYVIDNCSDAEDAWQLRNHGDLSIDVSTLEERIKRRASDLGCDMEFESDNTSDELPRNLSDSGGADSAESDSLDTHDYEITMTDECGCNDDGLNVNFDDLSPDVALNKIAAENDSIDEYLETLREQASVAEDAAEELDTDVEQVADKAAMLDKRVEELSETVDELQRPKMEEDAEAITEATDRFGETVEEVIEACDSDPEQVEAKRELVEDLATTATTDSTANVNDETEETETYDAGSKFAVTPWEDDD